MFRSILLICGIVQAAHANTCAESAPFDCPDGTVCNQWNDGCNDCSCSEGASAAMCTLKMCPCLQDNSCVPTCTDNSACVPKPAETSEDTPEDVSACMETAPFDCPEGTYCTQWKFGCNDCGCTDGAEAAFCTLKMCSCMQDNSCEYTCLDNPACVAAQPPPPAADVVVEEQEDTTTPTTTTTTSSTCAASAPFDCPDGTQCTLWTDGCNDCSCPEGEGDFPAACTMMHCSCYEDNSCVPSCKDNAACVPKSSSSTPFVEESNTATTQEEEDDAAASLLATCGASAPFDCPDGTVCTEWNDGCNDCGCGEGSGVAFCTMKMCPCLQDNSCVPTCKNNAACVPKTTSSSNNQQEEEPTVVEGTAGAAIENTAFMSCVESAPFDCEDGTYCYEWNDGCNNCSCQENGQVLCSLFSCKCMEDDTCVPTCTDNPSCVPKTMEEDEDEEEETNNKGTSGRDPNNSEEDATTVTTTTTSDPNVDDPVSLVFVASASGSNVLSLWVSAVIVMVMAGL